MAAMTTARSEVTVLPLSALQSVTRIITHASCPDGRASAVILHAALPKAEITEMAYGSPEHLTMPAVPGLLFCDFTPHKDRVAEFVDAGTIVLDHHRGTEDIVRAFGARGVFADEKRDPGVSGATLAMHTTFKLIERAIPDADLCYDVTMSAWELARLVGIRDTWQRQSPDWQRACEVSEVLRFLPLDACLRRGPAGVMATASDIGADLWTKKIETAKEAAQKAIRTEIGGRRVAIVSSVTLTSDVAEVLGAEVDIVAGFDYAHSDKGDRVKLQWSLRSHTGVDVSAIARRHGGNGHTAAAGFRVVVIDDAGNMAMAGAENPYLRAEVLLA